MTKVIDGIQGSHDAALGIESIHESQHGNPIGLVDGILKEMEDDQETIPVYDQVQP